jgi:iron complex outermembrane receptor protein
MGTKYLSAASVILIFLVLGTFSDAQAEDDRDISLYELSLEEVMEMEVVSVTRMKGQDVFTSPAAIYVITEEEIRRSGHEILPEVFKGVPGVHVGRINSNTWAISMRGFNEALNNKLLVLIDGRSIYTLRFGGVDWDMHNIPLELIERIEVIRGPGGTLWGANAYNGVINIITKHASQTQGSLLSVGGGSEHYGKATAIHGGRLDDKGYYRVYGKGDIFDDFKHADGSNGSDEWNSWQGGYRFDWDRDSDAFTLQGDFHYNRHGSFPLVTMKGSKVEVYNTNVLGKWSRQIDDDSDMSLKFYYDMINRTQVEWKEQRHVGDIEFKHSFKPFEGHSFVWGAEYNLNVDDFDSTEFVMFDHAEENYHTASAFVQDSFFLKDEILKLIFGTKIEYNEFTGVEVQPNVRLAWTPDERNFFWAAVSRAVRTPTRFEDTATIPFALSGNDDLDSEELIAYELGFRRKCSEDFLLDVALFANSYDDLIGQNFATGRLENVSDGEAQGVEVTGTWWVRDYWKLLGNYTFFNLDLHGLREDNEFAFPRNMANLKSFIDLNDKLEFNCALYYADNVSIFGTPSNLRFDTGLTYRPVENVEFSVWGQNLFESQQGPEMVTRTQGDTVEAQRAVFAKVTLRF